MNEERGKKAWDLHTEIIANEEIRRNLMAENARLLQEMREQKLYKEVLGDEDGSWAGYLSDIQVYYSRNMVHVMTTLYKRLTRKLEIDPMVWGKLPYTRLLDSLPYLKKDNWEDWQSKIVALTGRDWKITIRKAKGLTTEEDEHQHHMKNYDECTICGRRETHRHDTETAS